MLTVTVSTFPNAKALPLWVAVEMGICLRHGLKISLHETGSSDEQRGALVSGQVQIVQSAADNAVEVHCSGHPVTIFMGGEGGMNDLVAQHDVPDIGAFRGRILAVDSPETAYALLLRDVLRRHGLELDRDYAFAAIGNGGKRLRALLADRSIAGAVLNPPFTAMATAAGLRVLANFDQVSGPYQAGSGYALRKWVHSNSDTVVAYVKSYVDALAWVRDNMVSSIGILQGRLQLVPEIASATWEQLCDPVRGFEPRAALNVAGLQRMLDIRAAVKPTGGHVTADELVDLKVYDLAFH